MGYLFDESGMISDRDPVFGKLDELEERGDYAAMAALALEVPKERRSVRLCFALVSALINSDDWFGAADELRGVFPRCTERAQRAQAYYYGAYVVMTLKKNFVMALLLFNEALDADPNDELGLDIKSEREEAAMTVERLLGGFHNMCVDACIKIAQLCSDKDGTVLEGREAVCAAAFPDALRTAQGLAAPLDLYGRSEPEVSDADKLRERFDARRVTDVGSLRERLAGDVSFNLDRLADSALGLLTGGRGSAGLDESELGSLNTCACIVGAFAELLPKQGLLAWDIAGRAGTARLANAAGVITKEELCGMLDELIEPLRSFDSTEELLRSVLFGASLAAFVTENFSINAAARALDRTVKEIEQSGVAHAAFGA